jgi:hypothetical protein
MTILDATATTDLTDDEFRKTLRDWFGANPAPLLPPLQHIGDDVDAG